MNTASRPRRRCEDLIRQADGALQRDDLVEAEALCRRALMLSPSSIPARRVLADVLLDMRFYEEASEVLEEIVAQDADDATALADLGMCFYEMCEFDEAEHVLARALEVDPLESRALYVTGLCLERRSQFARADELFRRAADADPQHYWPPLRLSDGEFEALVDEALDRLPENAMQELGNLRIIVAELPARDDLLIDEGPPINPGTTGLFVGTPLPDRAPMPDGCRQPDAIYLYQRNVERVCRVKEEMVDEIRDALLFELGVYLGHEDADLIERGIG